MIVGTNAKSNKRREHIPTSCTYSTGRYGWCGVGGVEEGMEGMGGEGRSLCGSQLACYASAAALRVASRRVTRRGTQGAHIAQRIAHRIARLTVTLSHRVTTTSRARAHAHAHAQTRACTRARDRSSAPRGAPTWRSPVVARRGNSPHVLIYCVVSPPRYHSFVSPFNLSFSFISLSLSLIKFCSILFSFLLFYVLLFVKCQYSVLL